ncbi:MAG: MFS transporter [Chloroflexi bacterium]|nr:MFS transporter [Chloroflexota bacterium]
MNRTQILFLFALYGVEFLDELIYGLQSAVIPYIKTDLALTYTQIGLLSTIPGLLGIFADPFIGLLADTRHRRALVMFGIVATTIGLVLTGLGQTYVVILFSFCILYLASGAYVNLAQATLIDRDPTRAENTMARWTLMGAIGVTVAPLIATALFFIGYSWRGLYLGCAGVAGIYIALLVRLKFDAHARADAPIAPRQMLRDLVNALRHREMLRWLILTELADLMLDKLLEVTGLYFHDVVGVSLAAASGAVAIFSLAQFAGTVALVPLLERVRGLRLLRVSSAIVLALYAGFLLIPNEIVKIILLALLAFQTIGWYPILHSKSFEILPGRSGLVISVNSLANVSSIFVPAILGTIADAIGLQNAMWILALGPLALIIGLPRDK